MILVNLKKLFSIYNLRLISKKNDFINYKKFYILLKTYRLDKFYKNINFLNYLNLFNFNRILKKSVSWFNLSKRFNFSENISLLKLYKMYIKNIKSLIMGHFFIHYINDAFKIYQNIVINRNFDFKKYYKFD